MESETSCTTGYKQPPWKFQGSALYQLHLVKTEVARALVPKEFRLVEAFGYTLGGFFLASYDDSPAGVFDELVVIAGLVWNLPTSCAWASRVLVSSNEACVHGRKHVGLPSHVATFSKVRHKENGFLPATEVTQLSDDSLSDIFSINLINTGVGSVVPQEKEKSKRWMGPSVKMSLPSFSGRTKDKPCLLKYSCQMACKVRLVKPVRVTNSNHEDAGEKETDASDLSLLILLSKPVVAFEFNSMNMNVQAPLVIPD